METQLRDENPRIGRMLGLLYSHWQDETYGRMHSKGFAGIRPSHSPIFRNIRSGCSRAVDLASASGLTKQSIAYLIADLTKNGYLETVADPADGRARLVRLTRRGRDAEDALRCCSLEVESAFAENLGRERFEAMRADMGEMVQQAGLLLHDNSVQSTEPAGDKSA